MLALTFLLTYASAAPIKVVALNASALPLIHERINERMDALGRALAEQGYEAASLQEVWGDKAAAVARRAGWPHIARLATLAILARDPIVAQSRILFTCRPSGLRFFREEALANQGALMARVATPLGDLDVYDTQLIADTPSSRYVTLRLAQIFELSEMIRHESADRPFVLLGDLNMATDAPAYRVLVDLLGLSDACVSDGEDECAASAEDESSPRLEHVLLPGDAKPAARAEAVFAEPIPGTNVPYADRQGVGASLSPGVFKTRPEPDPARRLEALMRIESAIDRMVGTLEESREKVAWIPVYGFAAALRYDRELSQLTAVRARVETERIAALSKSLPADPS